MRKIKELLRLHFDLKLSNRGISNSIKVSVSTISDCLRRAKEAGLKWPLPAELDDEQLEEILYCPVRNKASEEARNIDWRQMHKELIRSKHMTRYLLWDEYKQTHQEGLSYSQFCRCYKDWLNQIDACMRQDYKAGEKMLVDYCGITLAITDRMTGVITEAQVFVACLGASNYTYAEVTQSQQLADWIASHVRAFEFYGGLPEIVVPDNLKSGVKSPDLYEPDLNPAYQDMAEYHGIAVIPARVRKAQDKAKVEEAVQNVERQILARLRNRIFFSLYEANQAIKELLIELNTKPFQKLPGSRKSQFEELEKPVLKPLPEKRYTFAEFKNAKLGIDYHICLDCHYYSAPYKLITKQLNIRYTQNTVEIFYNGKRVASHVRSYIKGGHTTVKEHMPENHKKYLEWSAQRIINWTAANGEFTKKLAEKIIESRVHPQQGYRSCLGIIRLADKYGKNRVENACKRAYYFNAYSYQNVKSILKNNLDVLMLPCSNEDYTISQNHEHVRGQGYYV